MKKKDEYRNQPENSCFKLFKSKGWEITKRGWPDFFAWDRSGKIALVEVKRHSWHSLKKSQHFLMSKLADFEIPCYTWTPDGGFRKLNKQAEMDLAAIAAEKEFNPSWNMEELSAWYSKYFLSAGHKRLGRIIVDFNRRSLANNVAESLRSRASGLDKEKSLKA